MIILKIKLEIDHKVLEIEIKVIEIMTTEVDMIEKGTTEIETIETQIGEIVAEAIRSIKETKHQNGSIGR